MVSEGTRIFQEDSNVAHGWGNECPLLDDAQQRHGRAVQKGRTTAFARGIS
jgi:hypothetical protein